MNKKEILTRLEDFSGQLDTLIGDCSIKEFGKSITEYLGDFDSFIGDLQDEIEEEEREKAEEEKDGKAEG